MRGDSRKNKFVSGGIIQMDVLRARYVFLVDVEERMNKAHAHILRVEEEMRISEDRGRDEGEQNEVKTTFTGKAKGFSKRKYVGTAKVCSQEITGMCASRQHPGILYVVMSAFRVKDVEKRCQIFALYAGSASLITRFILDVPNTDWEDIACGPCDTQGFGHCIYIADTGHGRGGPMNIIYKLQEPEEIIIGETISFGEEEIEATRFESPLKDSQTLLVSPRGRLFVLSSHTRRIGVFEIVDDELKHLFNVAIPERYKHMGPYAGDISSDGKGFLIKFQDSVFYWYVEHEADMETVLTDPKQAMQLAYFEEEHGYSIAWRPDGACYWTLSQGCNEALYQYDRLDDVGAEGGTGNDDDGNTEEDYY